MALPRFFLALILFLPELSFAQEIDRSKHKDILWLQDQRSLGDGRLGRYLTDLDWNVRMKALLAFASIQDTSSLPSLIGSLSDSRPEVRMAAAFAVGQSARLAGGELKSDSEDSLLNILRGETSKDVQRRIIEALGKFGSKSALTRLLEWGADRLEIEIKSEVALSVARFAIRGITTQESAEAAARFTEDADGEVRQHATYALMRMEDARILADHVDRIVALTGDESPYVRMYAARALSWTNEEQLALPALIRLINREVDWRVAVNAIGVLSRFDSSTQDEIDLLLNRCTDSNEHISLTALMSFGNWSSPLPRPSEQEVKRRLMDILENDDKEFTWRQQGEAAVALSKLFMQEMLPALRNWLNSPSPLRRKIIIALSFIPTIETLQIVTKEVESTEPAISIAGIEALVRLCGSLNFERDLIDRAVAQTIRALKRGDLAVTTTAAYALADSIFKRQTSVDPLTEAYSKLHSPEGVEPMVAILYALGELKHPGAIPTLEEAVQDPDRSVALAAAKALRKVTGERDSRNVIPHTSLKRGDYDWEYLFSMKKPVAILQTNKGEISVELLLDDAPFTVLNFLELSARGFYRDLSFHRVVPNFVVQGGDPRGDGWGGPGYAIRSEFSLKTYGRGTVGMASAGKDTEGSQFFITHSPQPHLDGRYTIFGRVIDGMDVVDQIQVGDVLEAVLVKN